MRTDVSQTVDIDFMYVVPDPDTQEKHFGVLNNCVLSDGLIPQQMWRPKVTRVQALTHSTLIILRLLDRYTSGEVNQLQVCSPVLGQYIPSISYGEAEVGVPMSVHVGALHSMSKMFDTLSDDSRRFRNVQHTDGYLYGLTAHVLLERFQEPEALALGNTSSLTVDYPSIKEYTNYLELAQHHPMGPYFGDSTDTSVVDFCAGITDIRMFIGIDGKFDYTVLPRLFGFTTIEVAVRIGRMLVDKYGTDKLPYSTDELTDTYQQMTGRRSMVTDLEYLSVNQALFLRILHRVLSKPLDDLGIKVETTGGELTRDIEIVGKYFLNLVNKWAAYYYKGSLWVDDTYDPQMFKE